jgi:hypothetical protein
MTRSQIGKGLCVACYFVAVSDYIFGNFGPYYYYYGIGLWLAILISTFIVSLRYGLFAIPSAVILIPLAIIASAEAFCRLNICPL